MKCKCPNSYSVSQWTPSKIQAFCHKLPSANFRQKRLKIHTVAIWTFTFHKKSGFVKVILKANFKPKYRPVSWTFWSKNSDLLHSFSFYFLQELSNPVLFAHCWCYEKMRIIDLNFQIKKMISLASRHVWNWSFKFTTHSLVFCEIPMCERLQCAKLMQATPMLATPMKATKAYNIGQHFLMAYFQSRFWKKILALAHLWDV